jgi:hypothetical protein
MEKKPTKNRMPKRLTITAVEMSPEAAELLLNFSEEMKNLSRVSCTQDADGTLRFISIADSNITQVRQFVFWITRFIDNQTKKSPAQLDAEIHQMD